MLGLPGGGSSSGTKSGATRVLVAGSSWQGSRTASGGSCGVGPLSPPCWASNSEGMLVSILTSFIQLSIFKRYSNSTLEKSSYILACVMQAKDSGDLFSHSIK